MEKYEYPWDFIRTKRVQIDMVRLAKPMNIEGQLDGGLTLLSPLHG